MAYISHSSFDYRSLRERAGHASPVLFARCAFVALAAAIAILALSEGRAPAESSVTVVKGDRLATAQTAPTGVESVATHDLITQTSVVEKAGAATLGPVSPVIAGSK